jgi:outer membrane protein assembly factor BamB
MKLRVISGALAIVPLLGGGAGATETEHLGIRIVPAPGRIVVDGRFDDWDLSAGLFVCGDVENRRDEMSVWFHLMYDARRMYVLARWNDHTPLNNPGSVKGDYGFAGDCLQVRFIMAPGDARHERTTHLTCWRDRDGLDVVDVAYGRKFDQGKLKDAQKAGAVQEFRIDADGRGYVQEISLPWTLLCGAGYEPKAGDRLVVTVEPNFGTKARARITIKDIFRPGVQPDRVFTFMSSQCWGFGTLERTGRAKPGPVRLADGREFKVRLEAALPVVDWTGLIRKRQLPGHKLVEFTMPADGYVSLNVRDRSGAVVRHLLNAAFRAKGRHQVRWDGLTTPNWRTPGEPVEPGEYTWDAIWHEGIGLRLVGWAHNAGSAPWDGPSGRTNWGGDHGVPSACDHDGERVYLGWTGAEAGKALLACDPAGRVIWRNSRGGMAGCDLVAVDAGTVYGQNWHGVLYRLDAKTGGYTNWLGRDSTDLPVKSLWPDEAKAPQAQADAMYAAGGRLYLSLSKAGRVAVLDGRSGKLRNEIALAGAGDLEVGPDGRLYVLSQGKAVVAVEPDRGRKETVVDGLTAAAGLAIDRQGRLYVGVGEPDSQVRVHDAKGKLLGTIGRKGGRAPVGRWQADGMRFIRGMTVDAGGKLWVMEADELPKRVSVWDPATGRLVKELFGPTSYGALGGAISPADPRVMVGHGCEWRLDAKTGRARCVAVIARRKMSNARFAAAGGRLYLAVASNWAFNAGPLWIYERVGEGDYRLRTTLYHLDKGGREIGVTGHGQKADAARTACWADANGDQKRQPDEITSAPGSYQFSRWYMYVAPDLSLYSGSKQFKVAGFTPCGAPRYDLASPVAMPADGLGSADGRLVLQPGGYGLTSTWLTCWDIRRRKRLWRYPDNFNGVHGSHRACPPRVGMIRGSYGPCGTAKLPDPIGCVWVIPTNVGEWHLLTEAGFYLARVFEGDPMKMAFPDRAGPGAVLDRCPPGMGGEDFGGSIASTADGQLYVQAGKTAFWNARVTGLETVRRLPGGGRIAIAGADLVEARRFRQRYLQDAVGTKRMTVRRLTPAFTGAFDKDFQAAGAEVVEYLKQARAGVRSAAAWDERNLYLAWDVRDATPWVNGAGSPEYLYARGDTVDFQLATDPKADTNRPEAAPGDLRLSIGPLKGAATAVLYRPKAKVKAPKTFYSGVVRDGYTVESVTVLKGVRVKVTPHRGGRGYVVEAAVPLAALGLQPREGLRLRADFGVTHGDSAGKDTVLRTYWHNQVTGIVNDEVFELKLEPRNWGEIVFRE